MSDTTFVNAVTVIPRDWAQDVNDFIYRTFGTIGGVVCIGDNANSKMTIGLTINMGAADNEILSLKSSDVAHGMTDEAETDTFGFLSKVSSTAGGVQLYGLSESTGGIQLQGAHTTDDTTKSTAGRGAIRLQSVLKSGTTVGANGANSNLVTVDTNGTTRFILDADGDSHQDVGTAWTNFDSHDDVALLNATSALLNPDSVRIGFSKNFLAKNKKKLKELGVVTFNRNGHHFINWSRFHMLHMGATRWLAEKVANLETRLLA
jgi:hypothetical protein